jgi:hypothetical protein
MLPFPLVVQDFSKDAQVHVAVSKEGLAKTLNVGNYDSIAVFEMVGEPFQPSMEDYVRQMRAESDRATAVIVLVEKPPAN